MDAAAVRAAAMVQPPKARPVGPEEGRVVVSKVVGVVRWRVVNSWMVVAGFIVAEAVDMLIWWMENRLVYHVYRGRWKFTIRRVRSGRLEMF